MRCKTICLGLNVICKIYSPHVKSKTLSLLMPQIYKLLSNGGYRTLIEMGVTNDEV